MNSGAEKVQWVERLCDLVEGIDPEALNFYGKPVSIAASVAAIRVHYYIGGSENTTEIYNRLEYLLTDKKVQWDDFNIIEQRALLRHVDCHSAFVYP